MIIKLNWFGPPKNWGELLGEADWNDELEQSLASEFAATSRMANPFSFGSTQVARDRAAEWARERLSAIRGNQAAGQRVETTAYGTQAPVVDGRFVGIENNPLNYRNAQPKIDSEFTNIVNRFVEANPEHKEFLEQLKARGLSPQQQWEELQGRPVTKRGETNYTPQTNDEEEIPKPDFESMLANASSAGFTSPYASWKAAMQELLEGGKLRPNLEESRNRILKNSDPLQGVGNRFLYDLGQGLVTMGGGQGKFSGQMIQEWNARMNQLLEGLEVEGVRAELDVQKQGPQTAVADAQARNQAAQFNAQLAQQRNIALLQHQLGKDMLDTQSKVSAQQPIRNISAMIGINEADWERIPASVRNQALRDYGQAMFIIENGGWNRGQAMLADIAKYAATAAVGVGLNAIMNPRP